MRLRQQPDFEQFLKVLRRDSKPDHLPFYEHIASPGFMTRRTGADFGKMTPADPEYWPAYLDFWIGMGFDCVPMEIPLRCPLASGHDELTEGSEAHAVIRSVGDYEEYPWPSESDPIDFSHFETVARLLPDGARIVGGVSMGPYEWASQMMGVVGLSYALADDPELVELVFTRLGKLIVSADRQLASMDAVCALRQGDDLGFKTATFLSPELLRRFVFPIYKKMVAEAHAQGKPFILHSCGNLENVYEDLIEECKIDAKHSFENAILPVADFKKRYGTRVTALGGLDVDVICRSTPDEVRAYARKNIEECFADGFWALGTGNSLTDYMPVENYVAALEEGIAVAG